MSSLRRATTSFVVTLAVVLGGGGCIVVNDHRLGWANFEWTLDEHRDGTICSERGATTMDIVVYDDAWRVVDHVAPACSAFGATVELFTGRYTATMVLLDANRRAVSTTLSVGSFYVSQGQSTFIAADFPARSFY